MAQRREESIELRWPARKVKMNGFQVPRSGSMGSVASVPPRNAVQTTRSPTPP
jgi:hypothetical protein